MSAKSVIKTSCMSAVMQEAAINAAQDAIANFTTEQEIASSIKSKFEQQFPSTYVPKRCKKCYISCAFLVNKRNQLICLIE